MLDDTCIEETSLNTGTTDTISIEEVEWRASAVYVKTVDAHAIYPIDPKDVGDRISRHIFEGTHKTVAAGKPVNPANIREFGDVGEEAIEQRLLEFKPSWVRDMPTYVERIQSEGLRTRALQAYREGHQELLAAPWRAVDATHAQAAQKVSSVQIGGVGGGEADIGVIFDNLVSLPEREMVPLPFPWKTIDDMMLGGMFPGQKYCFSGAPGQRKTTALFMAIHHAVMHLGKTWIHFPFDGGTVNKQTIKFFVVHWTSLLLPRAVPLVCRARVRAGGIDTTVDTYAYTNPTVAYALLKARNIYSKESHHSKNFTRYLWDETGIELPGGAYELFEQACGDMSRLRTGGGPGRLVMVSPMDVGSDVYRMTSRLRNEFYGGGFDAFSVDHIGEPENQFRDPILRYPENTRVLCGFTNQFGPPCIIISQLSADGVGQVGKGNDNNPHFKYNTALWEAIDAGLQFQYKDDLPDQLNVIAMKNRDGRGGPKTQYRLRVHPVPGWIWDDPQWAVGHSGYVQPVRRQPNKQQEDYDDND